MKILITGGCGYVGNELVKNLLKLKHKIIVVDTQWFGNNLQKHKNLKVFKSDIRNIKENLFKGQDALIHLANIANDPAVDLNPSISWDVNVIATEKLIQLSIKHKLKKFIFASSGSVYGIKKEKKVTENLELVPISTYNKTKMVAEKLLMSYQDRIKVFCIRPATVCGLSDRMRFDVTVNLLTLQALEGNEITVFGGKQIRPNIHIQDMIAVYRHFLDKNLKSGFYNAGFQNLSVVNIAKIIAKKLKSKIKIQKLNDPRSYRIDSSKLIKSGFVKTHTIEMAIDEITEAYRNKKLKSHPSCYTVQWMKKLKIK